MCNISEIFSASIIREWCNTVCTILLLWIDVADYLRKFSQLYLPWKLQLLYIFPLCSKLNSWRREKFMIKYSNSCLLWKSDGKDKNVVFLWEWTDIIWKIWYVWLSFSNDQHKITQITTNAVYIHIIHVLQVFLSLPHHHTLQSPVHRPSNNAVCCCNGWIQWLHNFMCDTNNYI
jgi:hypothetical protein